MSQGGERKGPGSPKGSRNKKTIEFVEKALAGGESPLEFLVRMMHDAEMKPDVRIDCAKAAAPYVHAKLSSINVEALIDGEIEHTADDEAVQRAVDAVRGTVEAIAKGCANMGGGAVQE